MSYIKFRALRTLPSSSCGGLGTLLAPRALWALLGAFGPQWGYNVQTFKEKFKKLKIAVTPSILLEIT